MTPVQSQHHGRGMSRPVPTSSSGLHLVTAANIKPKPINWLIEGWLAAGQFHLLVGPSSSGKSTVATALMASISNGRTGNFGWPGSGPIDRGDVIFWTSEDHIESVVMPRLIAAGADLTRVHILCGGTEANGKVRPFNAQDLPRLGDEVERLGNVGLIVIDPILSVVPGDSNSNTAVRNSLEPLVELAENHDCAILGITHVNKSSKGKEPLDKVNGSLAYVAVPRVVMMTAVVAGGDPSEGPNASVLVRAKSNIGSSHGGLKYWIEPFKFIQDGNVIETSRIAWSSTPLTGSAKEILNNAESGGSGGSSKAIELASDFLKAFLANGGRSFPEIKDAAQAAGIAPGTLDRAKLKLGISSKKQSGMGRVSPYYWSLPPKPDLKVSQPGLFGESNPSTGGYRTPNGSPGGPFPNQFQSPEGMFTKAVTSPFTSGLPQQPSQMPVPSFDGQPRAQATWAPETPAASAAPAAPNLSATLAALAMAAMTGMSAEPAEPAEPAAPAEPVLPSRSHAAEPGETIDQSLLDWMVGLCKVKLTEYMNERGFSSLRDVPFADVENVSDEMGDQIAPIEADVIDSGLCCADETEYSRLEPAYQKALRDTNWWADHFG